MSGLARLRYLAEINPPTPEFDRVSNDTDVTFMPLETVWADSRVDTGRLRPRGEVASGYVRFRAGDILCPKVTPTFQAGRSAYIAELPAESGVGAATTEVHVVRARPGIADARFLRYGLMSKHFLEEGVSRFQGVAGLQRVPDSFLRDLPVAHLPLEEQRRIADFLDDQVTRIDSLIGHKRQMVALTAERSLREQAGLAVGEHLPVPRRQSGLDWLGMIPESWPVERLKFVARLESGHTPSRTDASLWEDCNTPWVTLNDVGYIEKREFIEVTVNKISQKGLASSSARVLPAGTVVLSRDATVGRCGILAEPMATSQHFVAWVCGDTLRARYLWLLMRTVMQTHFGSLTAGATIKTIGMPDIKRLRVPIPSLQDQDRIVSIAEERRLRTQDVERALSRQILLFQERKRALITAAVTGEFEVSSAGPRAADAVTG